MLAEADRASAPAPAETPAIITPITAESPEASIGHAAVVGAVVGYFVVLTLVGGIVFGAAGAGLGTALAVGAFAAIWGGLGWGGMIGAQIRAERLAADERSAHSSPS
jgi:hypothetical protein